MLRVYSAEETHAGLDYPRLIEALRAAFASADIAQPLRAAHQIGDEAAPAHLLTMPAWRKGDAAGVKLVTVFPQYASRGLGAVSSIYVLFDGETGVPRALIDGEALTNRRTAAASALASSYLSRTDAATLAIVGTGNLAAHLAEAHGAVRPISRILVWGRNPAKAAALSEALRGKGLPAEAAPDLDAATA
jgi:ornithine cyclodeaminase